MISSSGDYKIRFCSRTHMHSGMIIARLQWRTRWEAFNHEMLEMDWLL